MSLETEIDTILKAVIDTLIDRHIRPKVAALKWKSTSNLDCKRWPWPITWEDYHWPSYGEIAKISTRIGDLVSMTARGIVNDLLNPELYYTVPDDYNITKDFVKQIHKLIEDAPLMECISSPSEYIREYRKLYERSKNENSIS